MYTHKHTPGVLTEGVQPHSLIRYPAPVPRPPAASWCGECKGQVASTRGSTAEYGPGLAAEPLLPEVHDALCCQRHGKGSLEGAEVVVF